MHLQSGVRILNIEMTGELPDGSKTSTPDMRASQIRLKTWVGDPLKADALTVVW